MRPTSLGDDRPGQVGAEPLVDWENDKPTVVALREIAEIVHDLDVRDDVVLPGGNGLDRTPELVAFGVETARGEIPHRLGRGISRGTHPLLRAHGRYRRAVRIRRDEELDVVTRGERREPGDVVEDANTVNLRHANLADITSGDEFLDDGDTIDEVKFSGRGCAISQAATSMLTEMSLV